MAAYLNITEYPIRVFGCTIEVEPNAGEHLPLLLLRLDSIRLDSIRLDLILSACPQPRLLNIKVEVKFSLCVS